MKIILLLALSSTALADYDAKISLGERLFNDPRFSKEFVLNASDMNDNAAKGTSCIDCHKVDSEFDPTTGLGMHTYSDNTAKTPVPLRLEDKIATTLRNTPPLVGIGSPYAEARFSHWDGEFADHSETVIGNFAGRNTGWLVNEKAEALQNIVNVIKKDNGSSELAHEFGGSYERVFLGVDPSLPEELRLKASDRVDVLKASDEQIINLVVDAVTAYIDDLDFERDENDQYIGSPYDKFLLKNNLPTAPAKGQSIHQYMIELRSGLAKLESPQFVAKTHFATHGREFGFGPQEWEGLKVFFNLPKPDGSLNQGMCLSCHKPPMFTDYQFHNVGVAQLEYDKVHGEGSFNKINIPDHATRGDTTFLRSPIKEDPSAVDLGVWNFFDRKPEITKHMRGQNCSLFEKCTNDKVLPLMIAKFKTPSLRNLNHSAPYFHNGSSPHLYHLLHQYKRASDLMRKGELRNGDVRLKSVKLFHHEIHSLVPFLESLNEEYE